MANWQDFTAYVDQYKGQLSAHELQVLSRTYTAAAAGTAGSADSAQKDAINMLARKFGWDQRAAANFVAMNSSVMRKGGENADAFAGWTGELNRSQFASDDEYRNAIINWMGLPGQQAADPSAAADAAATEDISSKIDKFARALLGGIPDDDPTAQYIMRRSVNMAQAYGGRAGLSGRSSLGAGAVLGESNRGLQAYDFQRKQLGAQALGMLSQRDIQLGQLQQGFNQAQNRLAENQFAQKQNQSQALGALFGGVIGTGIGAYAGGPQGAAIGANVGSQGGAGIAGMFNGFANGGPRYQQPGGLGGRNPYTGG